MDKTPNNVTEQPIELPKNIVPSLPMNPDWVRWPSCFSSVRISEDGMCREVILNETAWSEAGKVWKFYPSSIASRLEKKLQQIKNLPFFATHPDIIEDVDTLGDFVTQMWSIDDGFLNHSERRDFYDKNDEVSVYCSKISKLRKNYMGYLGSAVYIINRTLGIQIDTPSQ